MTLLVAAAWLFLAAPTTSGRANDAAAAPKADDEQTSVEIAKLHEQVDALTAEAQQTHAALEATQTALEATQASADSATEELRRQAERAQQVQESRVSQQQELGTAEDALRDAYQTVATGTPDASALDAAQAALERTAAQAEATTGSRAADAAAQAASNVARARQALTERNYLDAQVFLTRAFGGAAVAQTALATLPP